MPAVTLGVAGRDAWQSPLRYHVTAATPARPDDPSFTAADDGLCDPQDGDLDLCTRGELEIRGRGDDPRTASVETHALYTIANGVPAVVLSGGANGRTAVPPPSADEARNLDGSGRYVLRDYARGSLPCADDEPSAPACAFDDLRAWIAPTVLANRLVRAGRLP